MLNPIIADLHRQVLSESTSVRHHQENLTMLRMVTVHMLRELKALNGNYLQCSLYYYLLDNNLYPVFVSRMHDFYIHLTLTRDVKGLKQPVMHEVLYQHFGTMFYKYTQQSTLDTYNDIFRALSLFRTKTVSGELGGISGPSLIGTLMMIVSGVIYGYPCCCNLEHAMWRQLRPGSPEGIVPRAAARKRSKETNATAWWEGSGYVPCETCGSRAHLIESQRELLNAIEQRRITPIPFETKNLC